MMHNSVPRDTKYYCFELFEIFLFQFKGIFRHQGGWQGPGEVVKAACLESRRSRLEPHSGLHVSKKQIVSSPLTRGDFT